MLCCALMAFSRSELAQYGATAPHQPFAIPPALLEFRNLTVGRGERIVLRDLDLTIGQNEHVAILGPNGSGKSTLIKVVTREVYPLWGDDFTLRILGQERWVVEELRKHMGIVTNDLVQACCRQIPAREIILSGFFSSIGVWPWHEVTPAMEDRTAEILELLEISRLADREGAELSSGELRRVVIGRALVHGPQALILDEPTASLDFRSYHEIRTVLRKLAATGVSLILVTHHLPDIIPEVERVILLQEGKIVADGEKSRMLTSGQLSKLFGVPLQVAHQDGYYNLW
jgi:iron complex transport system ATP-binding protein